MSVEVKSPVRRRILDAAVKLMRAKGYSAATVDDLCAEAGATKGAFFHHFKNKDALAEAAAGHWTDTTAPLFASAPYHSALRPLDRVLAYIDFRRSMIRGQLADFTCLAGTLAQELHTSHPQIARAGGAAITFHAMSLVKDIEAAMADSGKDFAFPALSLALHTQAVLQGGFVLAKATGNPEDAAESIRHLRRYVELLLTGGEERQ